MAALLYTVFVAIVRSVLPRAESLKRALGFSKLVADTPYPSDAIVDLATIAEGTTGGSAPSMPPAALAGAVGG
jgi:hypothetical protein